MKNSVHITTLQKSCLQRGNSLRGQLFVFSLPAHLPPHAQQAVFGQFVHAEIGRFHFFRQIFREAQLQEAGLRVDDGDGEFALGDALRFVHGFRRGVASGDERRGGAAVGDDDQHRVLQKITENAGIAPNMVNL